MSYNESLAYQQTQPLLSISRRPLRGETREERFQWLKKISDTTGIRFIQVYLIDQRLQSDPLSTFQFLYEQKR